MISQKDTQRLRDRLVARRKDIFALRKRIDQSWDELHEPQVEYEEQSQMEHMAQGIDHLDEQEKNEIEAIDMALHRIESGNYGVCESCGGEISAKRLEAIPWTPLCRECAGAREGETTFREGTIEEEKTQPGGEKFGLRLIDAVNSKLQEDGRIDSQELEVNYREGLLYLEGSLPSREEHHILMEIVQDILDLQNIVDNIRINPVLWERRDRAPGRQPQERKTDEQALLEGEDSVDDTYESLKDGTSVDPADTFTPEKGEK
jgi:RNA polymerase-binding transcription factor DksA